MFSIWERQCEFSRDVDKSKGNFGVRGYFDRIDVRATSRSDVFCQ